MNTPIIVVTDWQALPGGRLQTQVASCHTEKLREADPQVIFALNTRFTKVPKVEDLAPVGVLGVLEGVTLKKGKSIGTFNLQEPVKLLNISFTNELFSCEFESYPGNENTSDQVALATNQAKGVFAEFLRRISASPEARWQEIGSSEDPEILLNLLLEGYASAKGERNMSYKYFSCFDKQRLIEIASPVERLAAFTHLLCERINCDPDSPPVVYNPSDPFWSYSSDALTFKSLGKIQSNGVIMIGCPSRLDTTHSSEGSYTLNAKAGEWAVFRAKFTPPSADHDGELIAYIISQKKPQESWSELVSNVGDDRIEVSSGIILGVAQELLKNEEFIQDICDSATESISSYSYNNSDYKFLCIETGGDGGYPVKIIKDAEDQLEMAIIYKEVL